MSNETEQVRWVIAASDDHAALKLTKDLALPELLARLLVSRGYATADAARAFLHPSLDQLHSPSLMLGMDAAVARLRSALAAQEPLLIYGDYDVDGTVATVLLKTACERAAAAMGVSADVRYHIPHRIREGYGIQDSRIAEAAEQGVRLVISVDTGIRAFTAAQEAKRVGLDLIVTDHHLPDGAEGVPDASAVLNPNQPGCPYPYKELCGAAVAFKLAQALLENTANSHTDRFRLREKTLPSFLKLLAVATIADAVPLTGENRVIASLGLRELRKPSQAGLRSLMELAQIDSTRPILASDIGFRLAPRINAAGRMDIASDVVELFLAKDPILARTLAEKLHRLNDERRGSEAGALRSIETAIETMTLSETGLPTALVLDDGQTTPGSEKSTWHRGIIGILASRVVDRTARPALVITHEDGQAYGSGRSVRGFHLLDALTNIHSAGETALLTRFGGHAYAVGFSLPSSSVAELRRRMEVYATAHLPSTDQVETLDCDAELKLSELTPEFLALLEQLGPFGIGNSDPIFVSFGVRLRAAPKIIKERHLRLQVEDVNSGHRIGAMAWARKTDWAAKAQREGWKEGDLLDIAYYLHYNWHAEFGGWELDVTAMRAHSKMP